MAKRRPRNEMGCVRGTGCSLIVSSVWADGACRRVRRKRLLDAHALAAGPAKMPPRALTSADAPGVGLGYAVERQLVLVGSFGSQASGGKAGEGLQG